MNRHGIHHVTAITANAPENLRFYTGLLGMRLVKKTVNQDDVSAYHLFYADGAGTPGTDLTFFDWPAAPESRGTSSIVRTGLRVDGVAALEWWSQRLREAGLTTKEIIERDNRAALDFEDPEGQRLSFVADDAESEKHPWRGGPVPEEHQIRGLGPLVLSVPKPERTERIFCGVLGMQIARTYREGGSDVQVYRAGERLDAGREIHVSAEPGQPMAHQGSGGVHHLALRTTQADYDAWAQRLIEAGLPNSGPVDRFYFRSLYFREPNGILIEIATDEPGFAADEPAESLGQTLALPPFLEPRRREIEAGLKPL